MCLDREPRLQTAFNSSGHSNRNAIVCLPVLECQNKKYKMLQGVFLQSTTALIRMRKTHSACENFTPRPVCGSGSGKVLFIRNVCNNIKQQ